MEYCQGGDIGKVLKRSKAEKDPLSEQVIWRVLLQVTSALRECHTRKEGKIFHRDLKPSNIFLDKDHNVKLGDFGLSKQLGEDSIYAYTHVGTPYYMAPEQCESECKYDERSDIWGLGCIIYEMACLHPPFQAENQMALAQKIKFEKPKSIPSKYSRELSRVIMWMLSKSMSDRPTVEELFNVPEVSMRMREKRLVENSEFVRKREEEYKKSKDELNQKQIDLKKREKELQELEAHLILWEKQLDQREKDAMLPPTPQPGRRKVSAAQDKGNTTGSKASKLIKKERQSSVERALSRNNSNSELHPLGSPYHSDRRLPQGRNSSLSKHNSYNNSNPGTPSSRRNAKGRQSATGLYSNSGKKISAVPAALYPTVQTSVPSFHLREDSPMTQKYSTAAAPPGYQSANKPRSNYVTAPGIPRCSSAKRRTDFAIHTSQNYPRYRNTSRSNRTTTNTAAGSNGSLTRESRAGGYGSPGYNYMKKYPKAEAPPRPRTGVSTRSNSQQRREMQDITNRAYPRHHKY